MPPLRNPTSLTPTAVLPESATHTAIGWCGVSTMLASCAVLNLWPPFKDIAYLALIVMACTALGIFIPDLLWQKVQRRTLLPTPNAGDLHRTLIKCIGLAGSIGFVALLYWLTPEYHNGEGFYHHYYQALRVLLPAWAVVAPFYIYWVDRRLAQPRDSLWQMGRLLSGNGQDVDARVIWQHLLGWLVKGFFLPLMFTYFCDNLDTLLHYDLNRLQSFKGIYDWSFFTLYFIDVSLVSMTYLMSLKATDTHIRSTEPTALGWISALVCYEPFWSLISRQYISYDAGKGWEDWLGSLPVLNHVWAVIIIFLVVVYVWATIAFGGRFSNLTHRGIITNGPYRFTKHPAYLSKNLSWWMLSMPFMFNGSWSDTLRHCVLLASLNFIYYLRAKTEERHLSLDPVYVQYAQWIDEHGLLRALNDIPILGALARWRPVFRTYTPPTPIVDIAR
jgi:protein-S-isoprenylcysteine O-methyltransferase Ste14